MAIYFILFIIALLPVFWTFSDVNQKRVSLIVAMACAIVCGLRDMLGGYDGYIYGQVFDLTSIYAHRGIFKPMTWVSIFTIPGTDKEPGYTLWNALIGIITLNRYIYFFITSLVVFYMFHRHCYKYTPYPNLTFFLFFCFFFFFTFTYLRQVMAAAIAWYSIQYAIDRKPIRFLLIVLLAYSFHNSAIIFLPVYLVASREITPFTMATILIATLILGFTPLGNTLFSAFGNLTDSDKARAIGSKQSIARIEYVIEAVAFFTVIAFTYNSIPKDKQTTCMLNIAYLFIGLLIFFVRFSDGGRISWFFLIGICCTFSNIYYTTEEKGTFCPAIIIMFAYLYFRILFGWGYIITPYKTFLTNGVQSKTLSRYYEYDHKYDRNKFYKW